MQLWHLFDPWKVHLVFIEIVCRKKKVHKYYYFFSFSLFQSFVAAFVLYKAFRRCCLSRPTLLKPSIRISTNYCCFMHSGKQCWWTLHFLTPNLIKYQIQNNKSQTFCVSQEVTDIYFKMVASRFYWISLFFPLLGSMCVLRVCPLVRLLLRTQHTSCWWYGIWLSTPIISSGSATMVTIPLKWEWRK